MSWRQNMLFEMPSKIISEVLFGRSTKKKKTESLTTLGAHILSKVEEISLMMSRPDKRAKKWRI